MLLPSAQFMQFKQMIRLLPDRTLTKEDLLIEDLRLAESGPITMYYAPHNETVNTQAKILIAGLTPGWSQMRIAFEVARGGLQHELPEMAILQQAKEAARFAGSMRTNLIEMLDALRLPEQLGLLTAGLLFGGRQELVHTTSVLRYPVFVDRQNYTGSRPDLLTNGFLRDFALDTITKELNLLQDRQALIIPLGKRVEEILGVLERKGVIRKEQFLWGFPHPSGANGHRTRQFKEHFESMSCLLAGYFKS